MTAVGVALCAMSWSLSVACIAALLIVYMASRNERRELIDRLYGTPPVEKESPMPKRYITAHQKAINKWRHKDDETQE